MKKHTTILIILILLSLISGQDNKWKINPTKDSLQGQIVIPKNLDDALLELDKMLTDELKSEIKQGTEKDVSKYHHNLGRWIRNRWLKSDLSAWFQTQKICHPDDMSGIILKSYYRHLNSKPLKIQEQIDYYIQFWEKRKNSTEE